MKKRDIVIILLALAGAAALYLVSQLSLGGAAADVVVRINGQEALRKPLAVDGSYEVAQPNGAVNVLTVEKGAAFVSEANCRDGLCISQGKMKNGAKTIVCLPHHLVVTIEGAAAPAAPDGLDIIIQ